MNVRAQDGCRGGHYDMQRQRQANAAAESRGDPLPHPYLPQLDPRSQAVCQYVVSLLTDSLTYSYFCAATPRAPPHRTAPRCRTAPHRTAPRRAAPRPAAPRRTTPRPAALRHTAPGPPTYSQALYGVDYFYAELERRSQRAAVAAAAPTISQAHAP